MINKIFQGMLSIFFMLYLSACSGTPPKPMNVSVKNINNISDIDKRDLLKISIEKVYRKNRGGFSLRDNTISQKNSYHLSDLYIQNYYIYDYLLDKTNTKLYMKDRSYSIQHGWKFKVEDSSDLVYFMNKKKVQPYINEFQVRLLQQYEFDVLVYVKFKEKYNKAKLEFDEKYQQIHIATKDTTKIVPSKIIKKLSKYQLWKNEETVLNSYRKGNEISFKIGSRVLKLYYPKKIKQHFEILYFKYDKIRTIK